MGWDGVFQTHASNGMLQHVPGAQPPSRYMPDRPMQAQALARPVVPSAVQDVVIVEHDAPRV